MGVCIVKKMISIIFLFVVSLLVSCSGQEKGELTRVDVFIENQNDIHIQEDTLALLEKTFEQIEWEPNIKADMSRKEDVMLTFFYSVEENMPERLYEYRIWFNSETATIISNEENEGFGELDTENLKIIKNIFFDEKVDNEPSNTESIEKITIYQMESNLSKAMVIEDTEVIRTVKEAFNGAEKVSGIVNMDDPQYKVELGEETYFLWIHEESGTIMNTKDTHTIYSLSDKSVKQVSEIIQGKLNEAERINNADEKEYMEVRQVAWKFIEERDWTANAKEDWQGAEIKETIADNSYELLDNNYEGKKALSVSFEDKENVVIGTPLILVDPTTKRVIGYMSGE